MRERTVAPSRPGLVSEIAALGDADLLRLQALARLRARGLPGLQGEDVFNEAVLRLLSGARRRPPDVPLVAVLAMAMRGVADDHWRRARRERPVMVRTGDPAAIIGRPDLSPHADPERILAAAQALSGLDRLFARDCEVLGIIAGLAEGLTPEEIRNGLGLDETAYDSARRRMRRALLKHEREEEPR